MTTASIHCANTMPKRIITGAEASFPAKTDSRVGLLGLFEPDLVDRRRIESDQCEVGGSSAVKFLQPADLVC